MKNSETEILNQVLNRWAANFRSSQTSQVLNDESIGSMNLFELTSEERATMSEVRTSAPACNESLA